MGKSRLDDELTDLLAKLYTIQEDIGAKPKTSMEEKKQKAENIATMGKGRKTEKKGSRFLELKSAVVDRLRNIHKSLKQIKQLESAGYGGDNAKEIIKVQAEVREQIRQASDEWSEMDEIYKKEARKKRSKFTPEELEIQLELVKRLHAEIEKIKEAQMRGYARGRTPDAAVSLNTTALSQIGAPRTSSKDSKWAGTGGGAALTDTQQQQILQLEERDADFDKQLDEIGEGIQDLAELAQLQGEEVQRHNIMLENLNNKIDQVNERVQNVNSRMKETLEEVRSGDKLCIDIMCIVLAIGLGAVIYNFAK